MTHTHTVRTESSFVFILIEEEKGRLFLNRVKSLTSPRLELSTDQNEREKQGSAQSKVLAVVISNLARYRKSLLSTVPIRVANWLG